MDQHGRGTRSYILIRHLERHGAQVTNLTLFLCLLELGSFHCSRLGLNVEGVPEEEDSQASRFQLGGPVWGESTRGDPL